MVLSVSHKQFIELGIEEIKTFCHRQRVIYDLKHLFHSGDTDLRL